MENQWMILADRHKRNEQNVELYWYIENDKIHINHGSYILPELVLFFRRMEIYQTAKFLYSN